MPKRRRSPVRHEVSGYTRKDGTNVSSYHRGLGKRTSRHSRRVYSDTFNYFGVSIPKVITDDYDRIGWIVSNWQGKIDGDTNRVLDRHFEHIDRIELSLNKRSGLDVEIFFKEGMSPATKEVISRGLHRTTYARPVIEEDRGQSIADSWDDVIEYHKASPDQVNSLMVEADAPLTNFRKAFG